jgi:phosphate-transporting ATPase
MLTVRGLSRPGLRPFDLDLEAGEAVAVLGPSGAGKSLLLRTIADLDPNEGAVALDDQSREAMPAPAWRRQVTYLAAEPGWWASRVGDHFAESDRAVALFPELLLPEDTMGWEIARMSTGERQRAALARVLVLAPRVMLLDEPTSGLDADAVRAVEAVLRGRLEAGTGLLFVTHDEVQARRLARRCLRIREGTATESAL